MEFFKKSFLYAFILPVLLFTSAMNVPAANSPTEFFGARAFSNGSSPYYVVKSGDFNGDGKIDALIANLSNILVYYGNGDGKFSSPPVTVYEYSNGPLFPSAGDFNGDGRSDIAVRQYNSSNHNSLAVYLGNADKTFSEPIFTDGNLVPHYIEVVDYDADGKLDIVAGSSSSQENAIAFYKGNGDGSFVFGEKITTYYEVLPHISDFNNDSLPDVLFTSNDLHKISLNAGNGHFAAPTTINIDSYVTLQGVGDFNGDGIKDIVSIDGNPFNPWVTIWKGGANLTFETVEDEQISSRESIYLKAIADINNDQKEDLIFNSMNRTLVRKGLGDGTFTQPFIYGEGGNGDLFVEDVNADGWRDIVGAQPSEFAVQGSGSFTVMLNLQNGDFRSAPTLRTSAGTKDIAIADFNNDQLKDFVVVNRGSGGAGGDVIIIFQFAARNNVARKVVGSEEFSKAKSIISKRTAAGDSGIDPFGVVTGDFTQDNKTDIVVVGRATSGGQNGLLLTSLGNTNFTSSFFPIGTGEIYDVATADFNSDGKLDLVTTGYPGVSVSFGNGNGTFAAPVNYLETVAGNQIAVGDFNNDAKADIAVANYNIGKIGVLLNDGSGTFINSANITVNFGINGVAAADMNSDGKIDLIAATGVGVSVLNGIGGGAFDNEVSYRITPGAAVGMTISDFNGDAKPDAALYGGTNIISVLLNNGAGGLGSETLWGGGVAMSAIVAGDLNNDQKNDLIAGFTTSYDGYLKLLYNLTESQPETRKSLFDFDGDGKTDVSIFRPSNGEWWYSRSSDGGNAAFQFGNSADKLVPADFTGDGKTDVAFFRPSTGEWFILRSEDGSYYSYPFGTNGDIPAVGDFDGDGKADSAVFRQSDTNWYIRRSSDSGTTITQFGASTDVPVVSDYDGDGKSDITIWRASVGEWWIQKSTDSSVVAFQFGNSSDKPVQGDYTRDGKADVAIWRPSTGEWFILRSEDQSYYSFPFGTNGDVPAPGDYDGDGRFDATVFRPSQSTWYVQRSTAGTLIQNFGIAGDSPVPNAFVP
jgi:hypothetical protein